MVIVDINSIIFQYHQFYSVLFVETCKTMIYEQWSLRPNINGRNGKQHLNLRHKRVSTYNRFMWTKMITQSIASMLG